MFFSPAVCFGEKFWGVLCSSANLKIFELVIAKKKKKIKKKLLSNSCTRFAISDQV